MENGVKIYKTKNPTDTVGFLFLLINYLSYSLV